MLQRSARAPCGSDLDQLPWNLKHHRRRIITVERIKRLESFCRLSTHRSSAFFFSLVGLTAFYSLGSIEFFLRIQANYWTARQSSILEITFPFSCYIPSPNPHSRLKEWSVLYQTRWIHHCHWKNHFTRKKTNKKTYFRKLSLKLQ